VALLLSTIKYIPVSKTASDGDALDFIERNLLSLVGGCRRHATPTGG